MTQNIQIQIFFSVAFIFFNCLGISQSCGEIYGINLTSNDFYLASINSGTGEVLNISTTPVSSNLFNNTSTIDPINNVLYFYSSNGITCVDLLSGDVISNVPITNPNFSLATLVYNCGDGMLYGLNINSGNIYLSIINPLNGSVSNVSNISVGQFLFNNTSTIDPINNILYFYSSDGITSVDLNTGSVLTNNPIINPNSFLASLVYNCTDGNLYGLNLNNGDFYLAQIYPLTGIVTNISNSPVSQSVFNNSSTLDPINELFYFFSSSGLTTVDINTGNILTNPPLINSGSLLATLVVQCNSCCLECSSNHGELMIQSIEGQND